MSAVEQGNEPNYRKYVGGEAEWALADKWGQLSKYAGCDELSCVDQRQGDEGNGSNIHQVKSTDIWGKFISQATATIGQWKLENSLWVVRSLNNFGDVSMKHIQRYQITGNNRIPYTKSESVKFPELVHESFHFIFLARISV